VNLPRESRIKRSIPEQANGSTSVPTATHRLILRMASWMIQKSSNGMDGACPFDRMYFPVPETPLPSKAQ
jgi:hypothetical protein